MKKRKKDVVISVWIVFGVLIVLGFFLFSMIIGGSALNGYRESGSFFVGNHGKYTEVTEPIFVISCVWGILFYVFIPLTPLGAFFIAYIEEKAQRRKSKLSLR